MLPVVNETIKDGQIESLFNPFYMASWINAFYNGCQCNQDDFLMHCSGGEL